MLGQNAAATSYQISHYFNERVATRKSHVHKAIYMIAKIVQEILKEVEAQEPRFISTLIENNGRYEGVSTSKPSPLALTTRAFRDVIKKRRKSTQFELRTIQIGSFYFILNCTPSFLPSLHISLSLSHLIMTISLHIK